MSRRPQTNQDDAYFRDLMQAAQAGDRNAYQCLLRELTPIIRRVVKSRIGDPVGADADDIVQDILMSIHNSRHTYDPDQPLLPWLMALCRRRIADNWRRSARISANETMVDSLEETFSSLAANSEHDLKDDRSNLHRAIADLPPSQRNAIRMLKIKEMSLKEASSASGMSVIALKVAVHRGIKTLKSVMGRETK